VGLIENKFDKIKFIPIVVTMMTNMKPKIELKSVKHLAANSQETHCFNAMLYVDGKRYATVSNDGWGGPDQVERVSDKGETIAELENRIGETFPTWKGAYNDEEKMTLDIVVGDLMNEWAGRDEFKKQMRRVTFVEDGKLTCLKSKFKPTAEILDQVKKHPRFKNLTCLNLMPKNEAFKLYLETAGC